MCKCSLKRNFSQIFKNSNNAGEHVTRCNVLPSGECTLRESINTNQVKLIFFGVELTVPGWARWDE